MAKVSVTDELLDAYVNRPLAQHIVNAVKPTRVTPNHLTLVSASLGTLAGALLTVDPGVQPYAPFAATFSLFASMVFDCSDGQLARARGGGSVTGRIYDGLGDYVVAFSLHLGILITLGNRGAVLFGHALDARERFLLVLIAGASMALNSGRFDFYKQRYLAHTDNDREPESPATYLDAAMRSDSFVDRCVLRLFAWYVRMQQGPAFLRDVAEAKACARDPERVATFIEGHGPLVRLWSFSGPTMHNALICLAAALVPVYPNAFLGYCLFAIVGVNVYCAVLALFQRRIRTTAG
ncbi:MAG: CDP-alcohol phosphatidyltransferase family protein [Polyangiales bacterium]